MVSLAYQGGGLAPTIKGNIWQQPARNGPDNIQV